METITIIKTRYNQNTFNAWKALLSAAGKDETKQNIYKTVYFSGSEAVTTDGHRLHMITDMDLDYMDRLETENSYKILVNTIKKIVLQKISKENLKQFPDYKLYIPDEIIISKTAEFDIIENDSMSVTQAIYKIITRTKTLVNVGFLADLMPGTWDLFSQKEVKDAPLLFRSGPLQVLIMGLVPLGV